MKRTINRAALAKKQFTSEHVGVLGYHAIQVKEAGAYIGHVFYNDRIVASLKINCEESCGMMQANIDFYQFRKENHGKIASETYQVQPDGYLVLINSRGDTPYRFQLRKVGEKRGGKVVADTQKLGKGAIYACTLLHPGTYQLTHNAKETTQIRVGYPTEKTDRKKLQEPVRLTVGDDRNYKKEIKVLPMQGLVFEFASEGVVAIQLTEAEKDRGLVRQQLEASRKSKSAAKKKGAMTKKTYHWRNPKYPQARS